MGTSTYPYCFLRVSEDHPHAYGDKALHLLSCALSLGSSPRVWGQACYVCSCCFAVGIIPTRMGTSPPTNAIVKRSRDHPHAYGDKYLLVTFTSAIRGSSPRVWGQVYEAQDNAMNYRIIPTRMGTRWSKADKTTSAIGSSPRVWGQVQDEFASQERRRIIPTRMGTSYYIL